MCGERKTPLWPWIAALLIGLPVLYVASFGPACWLAASPAPPGGVNADDYRPFMNIYRPLSATLASKGTPGVSPVLKWWIGLGVRKGYVLVLPVHSGSTTQAVQIYF